MQFRDPVREFAAEFFSVAYEDVTEEQRNAAKTITFAERYSANREAYTPDVVLQALRQLDMEARVLGEAAVMLDSMGIERRSPTMAHVHHTLYGDQRIGRRLSIQMSPRHGRTVLLETLGRLEKELPGMIIAVDLESDRGLVMQLDAALKAGRRSGKSELHREFLDSFCSQPMEDSYTRNRKQRRAAAARARQKTPPPLKRKSSWQQLCAQMNELARQRQVRQTHRDRFHTKARR